MRPPAHRRRMLAAIAVVLLLPGALYAAGARSSQFENHALASFPSFEAGWDYFGDVSTWTTDNIPLREQGVQVNNWIDEQLFGDPPGSGGDPSGVPGVPGVPSSTSPGAVYPVVLFGQDGYLFYGEDIRLKCEPSRSPDDIMRSLGTLAAAAAASGRALVVAVPPDKSTIQSEDLPSTLLGRGCAADRSRLMRERLAAAPYAVDLHTPVSALAATGAQAYLLKDSHWDGLAAVTMSQVLLAEIAPDVLANLDVRRISDTTMTGDLTVLTGTPSTVTLQRYDLHSPNTVRTWRTMQPIAESPLNYTSRGPEGTLVRGRTLFAGDSFIDVSGSDLPALFEDFTKVSYSVAASRPEVLIQQMVEADTIVVEIVERNFASGQAAILDPVLADRIAAELLAQPRS